MYHKLPVMVFALGIASRKGRQCTWRYCDRSQGHMWSSSASSTVTSWLHSESWQQGHTRCETSKNTHYTWASPKGWTALGRKMLSRNRGHKPYTRWQFLTTSFLVFPGCTCTYINATSSGESTELSLNIANKHCLVWGKLLLLVSLLKHAANSRQFISHASPENIHEQTHVVYRFDATFTSTEDAWINLLCFMQHEQFFQERQEMYPSRSLKTWNSSKNNPKLASTIPYNAVKSNFNSLKKHRSELHYLKTITSKYLNPTSYKRLNLVST